VEHDFGDAAREVGPDGGVILRAVGQDVDEARGARLTAIQSWTVGRGNPAAWAMAGMWSRRLVEPPKGRVHRHGIADGGGVRISRMGMPAFGQTQRPRGRCAVAISRHTAEPEGASALCGSAIPRLRRRPAKWRPCPETGIRPRAKRRRGSPVRRLPSSESSPREKRAPMVCTAPASSPSRGGRVTPPGTMTQGRSRDPASAIIMAGSPLSQVATPSTPARRGRERMRRRRTSAASLRYGRRIKHARGALRAAIARIADCRGERHGAEGAQLTGGGFDLKRNLPVSGVKAQRDRFSVRRAQAARRAEDEELPVIGALRVPNPCRHSA
jgi:hypothetical protein